MTPTQIAQTILDQTKALTPTYSNVPVDTITLHFDNNIPGTKNDIKTGTDYNNLYTSYIAKKQTYINTLTSEVTSLNSKSLNDVNAKNDRTILIGSNITGATIASEQATKIGNFFDTLEPAIVTGKQTDPYYINPTKPRCQTGNI